MDGEAALLIDHRMARIRAAMAADNEVRVTRKQVDDFALALVAPMPADDRSYRHRATLPSRRKLIRVRGSAARPPQGFSILCRFCAEFERRRDYRIFGNCGRLDECLLACPWLLRS